VGVGGWPERLGRDVLPVLERGDYDDSFVLALTWPRCLSS